MANKITTEEFNVALCDVRKAHRLIYAYQKRMLDLAYFVKSKLDFPDFGGRKRFSSSINTKRDSYADLKIRRDMCAWNFLYSYEFEYYFGSKSKGDSELRLGMFQIADTGFFDSNKEDKKRTDITSFTEEKNALSKIVLLLEKKSKESKWVWNDKWVKEKITGTDKILSKTHSYEVLNENDNVQIIYSFPLDRFLNEETTMNALKEFVKYCNDNGVPEISIV